MSAEAITNTVELTLIRSPHVCVLLMKVYSGILERFAWFNRAADTGGLRTLKGSIRSALTEIPADSISIIRFRAKETSVEGFYVTTCKF